MAGADASNIFVWVGFMMPMPDLQNKKILWREKESKLRMTRWWVETFTDHQVKLTEGSYRNLKVTYTGGMLPLAEKYLHS